MAMSPVKSGTKMQRRAFAQRLIDFLSPHMYPFGGYCRDQIADVDFEDIDFYMPSNKSGYSKIDNYDLRMRLRDAGYIVTSLGSNAIYADGVRLRKASYVIKDPATGTQITIDLVKQDEYDPYGDDTPFTSLDADVNVLWYDKETKSIEVGQGDWDLDSVKQHIRDRKFEIPSYVKPRKERLTKLEQKGYVRTNANVTKGGDSVCNCADCKAARNNQDAPKSTLSGLIQEKLGAKLADPTETKTSTVTEKKETAKMTTSGKGTFMETMKKDMENAAYRSASTQMTSAVKNGILLMMKDKGADGDKLKMTAELLDSEAGSAFVSMVLGHGLNYAPGIGEDPRVVRLAEEFRVAGYATGMNVVFGALMQYMLPGIMEAMSKLPPIPTVVAVTDADMKEIEKANAARIRVSGGAPAPDMSQEAEREALAVSETQRASKHARV